MGSIFAAFVVIAGILGLASAVAVIFALIYCVRRVSYALSGRQYVPLLKSGSEESSYEHQDVDSGSTEESVTVILKRSVNVSGAGKYARAGIASMDSCRRKIANFNAVLDTKFPKGTISWQKFSVAADITQQAVLRNCAALANQIQVFDAVDYRNEERERRKSTWRPNSQQPTETQIEKRSLFQNQLDEMQALIDDNDRMLLELDRLTAELGAIDDAGSSAESERLVEEIRTLADETKYYRQQLDDMDK